VLLGLTSLSTMMVGASWWGGSPYGWLDLPELVAHPARLARHLRRGVPFAATLLGILLSHEFGHFFAARHHRVEASPPYLIPFPSLLGTLGAVIRLRGRIPHRRALVDIGASGPLAGFVVALPLLLWGLSLSTVAEVVPPPEVPAQSLWGLWIEWRHRFQRPFHGVLLEGPSLLYLAAKTLVLGPIPAGHDVQLHPMAMGAWFGLFVTALNLLPIGQLDGGHVAFALLGRRARTLGRGAIALLVALGLVGSYMWLLWAFLGWKVILTTHPPVVDVDQPLDRPRRCIAWAAGLVLLLTFTPVPVQIY
jgi:membrane-associated protease RseP (regulator of RpoE activity)